jgi:hypothetical protein
MAIKVFCCYAREDEALLSRLRTQLIPLQREGLIEIWHDGEISAGSEWETELHKQLDIAQVILLLVSPRFMASDYCYDVEMKTAVERHNRGEAHVVPIILSPVHWEEAPFGQLKLKALPKNAKPVTTWRNRDEAIFNVADGIRDLVKRLNTSISASFSKDEFSAMSGSNMSGLTQEAGSYPDVAGNYVGSAYNKVAHATADITFIFKQLQGNICGSMKILTPGWIGSGPFDGTIDTNGHMKFKIRDESSKSVVLAEGTVYPDQSIGGIYTMMGYLDLGTWHIKRV